MTTTTVTTPDQTTLFVRDLGSGPAAVLLHGWTVGHELWDRQFETLPAAGVRCVAYDRCASRPAPHSRQRARRPGPGRPGPAAG